MSMDPAALVVGVDFGTLSGRAVVVRVRDGAELGTAVHDYRARRCSTGALPGTAAPLPPDWALQVPGGLRRRAAHRRARPRCAAARRRPGRQVIGIGTDFTACTMVPDARPTAPRCASCPSSPTEPHAYVKLWKHHAAQPQADRINALAARARRAVAAPLRRADLLGVGVRQGPAGARGGPGGLRGDASTGSRPPTGSSGS